MSKPITLYGHASGPNPWKVAIILEELNIPYNQKFVEFPDMKKDSYESLNPNGRVPTIEDPNTDVTLFESGAIIEYLIETYDKEKKLTYTTSPEKFQVLQWLHFQMSGQGPYFGQAIWFMLYHPERLPSAVSRYRNEIKRVLYVLNKALEGKEWLVGDKCTFADLAFVPWNHMIPYIFGDEAEATEAEIKEKYPNYHAWHKKLTEKPTVAKVLKDRANAMAAR